MTTQNAIELLEQAQDRVMRLRVKGERPPELVYVAASLRADIEDLQQWRQLAGKVGANPESVPADWLLLAARLAFCESWGAAALDMATVWKRALKIMQRLKAAVG